MLELHSIIVTNSLFTIISRQFIMIKVPIKGKVGAILEKE